MLKQQLMPSAPFSLQAHKLSGMQAGSLVVSCRCFFLDRPRTQLFERIDLRVEQMVAGGLLEVRAGLTGQAAS